MTHADLFGAAWIRWAASQPPPASARKRPYPEPEPEPVEVPVVDLNYFTRLPSEIMQKMLMVYLHPRDLGPVAALDKTMSTVLQSDDFWKAKCAQELRIKPKNFSAPFGYSLVNKGSLSAQELGAVSVGDMDSCHLLREKPLPYYDLYTKLIFPFRGLFDQLLVSRASEWGNILTISYKNGLIRGYQWFMPQIVTNPVIRVADFTVYVDMDTRDDMVINHLFCSRPFRLEKPFRDYVYTGQLGPKPGVREMIFDFRQGITTYTKAVGKEFTEFRRKLDMAWPDDEFEVPPAGDQFKSVKLWMSLIGIQICRQPFMIPLDWKDSSCDVPGIGAVGGYFKATFGPRGNQLIKVCSVTKAALDAFKVTGDSALTAGKQLFWFSMKNGMFVPPEKLDNLNDLELAQPWNPQLYRHRLPAMAAVPQVFRIPEEIVPHLPFDENLIPSHCLGRFTGKIHLFEIPIQGIQSAPQWRYKPTSANLIIFSPTRFLVIWFHPVPGAALFEKVDVSDPFNAFC